MYVLSLNDVSAQQFAPAMMTADDNLLDTHHITVKISHNFFIKLHIILLSYQCYK